MEQWTTRRIVILTLTVATVLYLVFYVPGAIAHFVGRVWDVVVILILSTALAVLLAPAVELLSRVRAPLTERTRRAIATLLVLAALVGGIWWIGALMVPPIIEESQRIGAIGYQWLSAAPGELQTWMDRNLSHIPPDLVTRATDALGGWTESLLEYQFDFAKGALLSGWYVVELLIVPVLAFYFLTDGKALRAGTIQLLPGRYRRFVNTVLDDVGILLDRYVRTLVALCVIKAVLVGLTLYLAGVSMYLTLAVTAGLFRLAPVVGPLVAGVPCVGIPLLQNGLHTGLWVLFFYALFIFLDGKLITPILLGSSATLHPVVVIIALLIGYEFIGVLGLLVAVPVAGIIRIAYLRYRETFGEPADAVAPPDGAPEPEPACERAGDA